MASVPTVTQREVLPSSGNLPFSDPSAGYSKNLVNQGLFDLGRTIESSGNLLADTLEKIVEEDRKREFKKLDTEFAAYIRTVGVGDGTAENPGFLNLKGENAISGYQSAKDAINAKAKQLKESASDPQVADMFTMNANDRMNSAAEKYLDHLDTERTNANDAVTKARIADAKIDALSDPSQLERSLAIIQGEVADQAARNGFSLEVASAAFAQERSDLLEKTISAQIQDNNRLAKSLLSQYAGEMDGLAVAEVKNRIEARDREMISDALRFDAIADEKRKEMENEVHRQARVRQAQGDLTLDDATGLLATGKIRVDQYDNILAAMNSASAESDNLALRNNYIAQLYHGEVTPWSHMTDEDLSDKDKLALTEKTIEFESNGGMLNTREMKDGYDMIETIIGGGMILGAYTDPQGGERSERAKEEFRQRVIAKENPQDVLDDIINSDRWRPTPRSVLTYPRPYNRPYGWVDQWPPASKAEAQESWKKAFRSLQDDYKAGKLKNDEVREKRKELTDMFNFIQRMIDVQGTQ